MEARDWREYARRAGIKAGGAPALADARPKAGIREFEALLEGGGEAPSAPGKATRNPPPPARAAPQKQAAPAPLGALNPDMRKRLKAGKAAPEAALDLHGMRQSMARSRLREFILESAAKNRRLVLVITGKGRPGGESPPESEGGVLRRNAPLWMEDPAMARHVAGWSRALPKHGGDGAMYVHLRRGEKRP